MASFHEDDPSASSSLSSSSSAALIHCCRYCYMDITPTVSVSVAASSMTSSSNDGDIISLSDTLMGLIRLQCGCAFHYSCMCAYLKDSVADKSLIPYGGVQCPNKVLYRYCIVLFIRMI